MSRSTAKSSSSHDEVRNGAPGEGAGAVLPGAAVKRGGCTVSPAWCTPKSKGTVPGIGTGSAGCSHDEDVPGERGRDGGLHGNRFRARSAGDGGGRVEPPAPEVAGLRAGGFEAGRPGEAGRRGGPGAPVVWTSPPGGSGNAGLIAWTMGSAVPGKPNCATGGAVNVGTPTGGPMITGNAADVAGPCLGGGSCMARRTGVDRAPSGPYLVVNSATIPCVVVLMDSTASRIS